MFELHKIQAKVSSVSPHAEKHGKENVPAISVKFDAKVPAIVLDGLDKTLRKILFRKPAKDEVVQGELPGTDETEGLTAKKYPNIPSLAWTEKLLGYQLDIGSGLESTGLLEIDDVKVSGFVIEAMDGGTVGLSFKCDFKSDAKLAGALCQMLQETVEISLASPQADATA